MCSECHTETAADPMLLAQAAPRGRLLGGEKVAREKAAIDGILELQDGSLSLLSDLVDELFNKFAPVLSRDPTAEDNAPAEQPYYGTSQVFQRINDQYFRTNNIADKVRILRRIAEV